MVKSMLDKLAGGEVVKGMYETANMYLRTFIEVGITPADIRELLKLKQKIAFLPEPFAYSLSRPGRGDYLLANFDSLTVVPLDENEERFMAALHSYYQDVAEYKHKMEVVSQAAEKYLKQLDESSHNPLGEEQERELLTKILLGQDIDKYPYPTSTAQRLFLEKFDLYDAYHIEDNRLTLRWQAGKILESKGLIAKGSVERIMAEVDISIDELKNRLTRHQIDKLRVDWVEVRYDETTEDKYISCRVDSEFQHARRLSVKDAELLKGLENKTEMAVKYFADVLEKNRREYRMLVDEKAFSRICMNYADRLIDIYKHGMNEQDVILSKASHDSFVDRFWWSTMLMGLEQYSVEDRKSFAFGTLTDYLGDLRPGQLTNEEVIELVGIEQAFADPGRELEKNFMSLPESFFPLIEQCGKYDRDVIDYAKVQRGIGRFTPTMAYNSMCYFLTHRLRAEWDPAGAEDDYGEPMGCYDYPNVTMENPAEKFPPNLLNEQQWSTLGSKGGGGAAKFIPYAAYPKNRITGVQVYPSGNGGLNIRCMVDGEQQGGKAVVERRCYPMQG